MAILAVKNLNFSYPGHENKVLDSIDFTVDKGEFVVVCGESGSGKSTLLRLLKRELSPHGEKTGQVQFKGQDITDMTDFDSASKIGFVMQSPDNQIVTDKVWSELAFGLENLSIDPQEIRSRVGEMANYFGIHSWFKQSTADLSGGQKQLLNLASVIVMQPDVLLLDEPTAQLDPIAAADFIKTVYQLNQELGITVIMVEHRLEEVFSLASKVIYLDKGRISFNGRPQKLVEDKSFLNNSPTSVLSLPAAVRLFHELDGTGNVPLNNKEGITFFDSYFSKQRGSLIQETQTTSKRSSEVVARMKNVWFRYNKNTEDVLAGVDLKVLKSDIFCLLGGNGSGKSTLIKVLTGLEKAYEGSITLFGNHLKKGKSNLKTKQKLAVLPQNPLALFTEETVYEDYLSLAKSLKWTEQEAERKIKDVADCLNIHHLIKTSPYDVSGGEQQLVALGKLLLLNPELLVLDEPTKGLDASAKRKLGALLLSLKNKGTTIFVVTHDLDFAASYGTQCALYFDHQIISVNDPVQFFSTNYFYTTATNKMVRKYIPQAICPEDVIERVAGMEESHETYSLL